MVESPPADAGDTGSWPSPGGSYMPRSGWSCEPWPLSLCVWSLCSATGEAATVRGPHTAKKQKQTNKKLFGYSALVFLIHGWVLFANILF